MTFAKRVRNSEVLSVLTQKWQTTSLITLQIKVRPESIRRDATRRSGGQNVTGSSLVSQSLYHLVKCGFAERRRVDNKRFEYRLTEKGLDKQKKNLQAKLKETNK